MIIFHSFASKTAMQLFYAPHIEQPLHTLGEEESSHCVRVLRLDRGATIHLTDGEGNLFQGEIVDPHPKRCTIRIVSVASDFEKRPYRLTIALAPTKNIDRYEWFLEKATEIGVDRIIPLECAHSERRTIKPDREMKVLVSAMKQSLKAYLPVLDPMTAFEKVIARPFDGVKLIAHCRTDAERLLLRDAVQPGQEAMILIGPEGDFSPEEIDKALQAGFRAVSLGNSRLRTETAGVVAASIVATINQ